MKRSRTLAGLALGVVIVGAALLYARSRAEPPARCASGMIPVGTRCCGEGQRLDDGDRCVGPPNRCAEGMTVTPEGCVAPHRKVRIQGGRLQNGAGDWEGSRPIGSPPGDGSVHVPPFDIDALEVTEFRYRECERAGGCDPHPHRDDEPGRSKVNVTLREASRFCAFAGGTLPGPEQFIWAAAGPDARRYAWGDTGAVCRRAAWGLQSGPCASGARGPELAGSHPDGASPGGVLDLAGNVAEWTLPRSPSDTVTDVLGGSWSDSLAAALRSWHRREVLVDSRSREVGFRCVYPPRVGPLR